MGAKCCSLSYDSLHEVLLKVFFTMRQLPTQWTAAQALALYAVLDDLRDLVVDGYAKKKQQAACLDSTVTTPFKPTNIDVGDVPF